MTPIPDYGYIPDVVQAADARKRGVKSDRDIMLELAAPWDATDIPPVADWSSYADVLDEYSGQYPSARIVNPWWQHCDVGKLFVPSQGSMPNCAGFAMSNAYMTTLISQIARQFSEQVPTRMNPMAAWMVSKGGSTSGGQTISAIATTGNRWGNCPASLIGEYDDGRRLDYMRVKSYAEDAGKHQIGISLYEGASDALPGSVVKACRMGRSVIVGNSVAVRGADKDGNGLLCARLGGYWSHATAFAGYIRVGTTDYVFWINSHGNIYPTDGTPAFGAWMDYPTLQRFLGGQYSDAAFVTYAEAPYNPSLKPTLVLGA